MVREGLTEEQIDACLRNALNDFDFDESEDGLDSDDSVSSTALLLAYYFT